MGLLSDPHDGSDYAWVKLLKRLQTPVCVLLYLGALVYLVVLAHPDLVVDTYFSENALLPGLVKNEFNAESTANQYYHELMEELSHKYEDTDSIPVPWLVGKMSQMHLEVYTHNFTLNYPLGDGQVYHGTNVYGIVRGARTASLEAIVVSAPYRSPASHHKGTAAGIALMLAFAKFARPRKYWAKDLIFLVTEHEQLGMQAWLEAYHGLQSDTDSFYSSLGTFWQPGTPGWELGNKMKNLGWQTQRERCLDPGKLKGRSGAIQAAINLEIHIPKIKYVEIKVEGLNGQLPNLDLVNLIHKLSHKSGIHHSFKTSYSWVEHRKPMDQWTNSVWTMLSMIGSLVPGVPNGNHGVFTRFGIEAVTLEGRDADDPAGRPPRVYALAPASFHRLGVLLESSLRSINNLLEKFHQSYFFYLMTATDKFVSIGMYMPPLCMMIAAIMIRALRLWVSLTSDDNTTEPKSADKSSQTPKKEVCQKPKHSDTEDEETVRKERATGSEVLGEHESEGLRKRRASREKEEGPEKDAPKKEKAIKKKVKEERDTDNIVNVGAQFLLVHLLGYAVMNSPALLTWIGTRFDLHSEVSVYRGLAAISAVLTLLSPFLLRLRAGRMTHKEVTFYNIVALVELATVCLILGMLNFSLGLFVATLYTPLALVVGVVTRGKRSRHPKRVLCVLLHPLVCVTIGMVVYGRALFPEENLLQVASRGTDAAMQAIMFSIVDSLIYGNWLFTAVTTVLLPVWVMFWQILTNWVV